MQKVEEVAGRVRDRIFVVTLSSDDCTRATLRERARAIAEQVAGNFF